MVLRLPHPADRAGLRIGDTVEIRGDIAADDVRELSKDTVIFTRGTEALPAKSQVQR